MRPDPRQQGFALVAAMFLIVVIALVIATMARLSSVQHGTNSLAIQQARAYQAARAGLEWGIARVVDAGRCTGGSPSLAGGSLSDFSVSLVCVKLPFNLYRLTATASNGSPDSRADYAWRQLEVTVER